MAILGAVVWGAVSTSAGFNAKYKQLHTYLAEAKVQLSLDDLERASALLASAKKLVPQSHGLAILSDRLTSLRKSKLAFTRGESEFRAKSYPAALLSFRQVESFDISRHAVVTTRLKSIEKVLAANTWTKVESAKRNGDFQAELDAIRQYNILFVSSNTFESARQEATSAIEARKAAAQKAAVSAMRVNHDKFQGETWYTDRTSPIYRNANGFYLYFGVSDGSTDPLRLVMQYYASDWLFINSAMVLVDGQTYDIGPINSSSWERDNDSMIWEWSDTEAGDYDLETIRAIIKSKSAVIRYDGDQYHDDRTITAGQKAALARVLTAYEALGGN